MPDKQLKVSFEAAERYMLNFIEMCWPGRSVQMLMLLISVFGLAMVEYLMMRRVDFGSVILSVEHFFGPSSFVVIQNKS